LALLFVLLFLSVSPKVECDRLGPLLLLPPPPLLLLLLPPPLVTALE